MLKKIILAQEIGQSDWGCQFIVIERALEVRMLAGVMAVAVMEAAAINT